MNDLIPAPVIVIGIWVLFGLIWVALSYITRNFTMKQLVVSAILLVPLSIIINEVIKWIF